MSKLIKNPHQNEWILWRTLEQSLVPEIAGYLIKLPQDIQLDQIRIVIDWKDLSFISQEAKA